MYDSEGTLVIYALDPLHVGASAGDASVDLPLARDVFLGDPILPFSAVRGMVFDACESEPDRPALLGAAPDLDGNGRRGAVTFTDARPLLFPVRSARGGFAWMTCARLLSAFADSIGSPITIEDSPRARVPQRSELTLNAPGGHQVVVIAGHRLDVAAVEHVADSLAAELLDLGVSDLAARLVVVPDALCRELMTGETERRHRVRIDTGGTAADGGLFSLEAIPRDTVLFAKALALSPKILGSGPGSERGGAEALHLVAGALAAGDLVIGGEATVGLGRCRARLILGAATLSTREFLPTNGAEDDIEREASQLADLTIEQAIRQRRSAGVRQAVDGQSGRKERDVVALARELPWRVRTDGLVKALADLAADAASEGPRTGKAEVLRSALNWLRRSSGGPFPRVSERSYISDDLAPIEDAIDADPDYVAYAAEDLQRFLVWLKRLAELEDMED